MRILFLDDELVRFESFERRHPNDDVTWVSSALTCMDRLLVQPKYDLVSLDHDLGSGADGKVVARFIADVLSRDKIPSKIIVHSWNGRGAGAMISILYDASIKAEYRMFQA